MPTVQVAIEDLEISFPFEPYNVQKALMEKVITCIKDRSNGLLESPTGTGKTLSLLCASLAWQIKEKNFLRDLGKQFKAHADTSNSIKPLLDPPTIIYASRTHSQLSQAISELKRTAYKNVKAIVMGSRDLMCIHEEVSRIQSSSAKITACHTKISSRSCKYYNHVALRKEDPNIKSSTVVDIEDIIQKGKIGKFCPFFMSKEMVKEADIVFMPYNYLLDPKLRSSHGIDLRNSVIILDEGHNIAKMCEEAVSFEIRNSAIALCIVEVTRAMNEFSEIAQGSESGPDMNSLTKDLTIGGIVRLKQCFLKLEEELDQLEGKAEGYLLPSAQLIEILHKTGFLPQTIPKMAAELDSISTFLTGNNHEASGCDKFASILRILSSNSLSRNPAIFGESYRVFVQLEESKSGKSDFRLRDAKPAKVFNFWCFNPAVGLETLMLSGPRSIILASGTLSPIPFLCQELVIPFPVQLSNPHIIGDKQLFAAVFKTGPMNVRLSSSYDNRNNTSYLESLGELIARVCSVVPKGVLVFFPSYTVMNSCVQAWQNNGLWSTIGQHKKVFLEPKGKHQFKETMDDYYNSVKTGGACLMAVCRGKVSEGLDFTDDNGRAVIITGIPYSPARDPHVVAKQQYLDAKVREGNTNSISGRNWYQLEATRALNQAIGRIIRHASDYGAILLCDERCDGFGFKQNLSEWVHTRMKSFSDFSEGIKELAKFFGRSVELERMAEAKLRAEKTKPRNANRILEDTNRELEDTTSYGSSDAEHLMQLYGSQEIDHIVTEMSSGRRAQAEAARSVQKTSASTATTIKEKKGGLFSSLGSTSKPKTPDFNFIVPTYSPSNPKNKLKSPTFSNPRKKIRIVSSNEGFSSMKSREQLMPTSSTSTSSKSASASGSSSKKEEAIVFESLPEFWQWVKLTLLPEQCTTYIKAIKKFKTKKEYGELGNIIANSFKPEHHEQCLKGMELFMTKEDIKKLRWNIILKPK